MNIEHQFIYIFVVEDDMIVKDKVEGAIKPRQKRFEA